MVGSQTGVVTRIKDVVPLFISTHCAAHLLSLVACNAADMFLKLIDLRKF